MKFYTVATVLLVSLFATSMALPATYYQQPSLYYQARAAPQRLMYMRYVQQPAAPRTHSRLTNGAAAYVAGDSVAAGTYLQNDEQQVAQESVLDNTGANGAQSIAEAYPASSSEVDQPQYDGAANIAEEGAEQSAEDSQVYEEEAAPVAEEADPEPSVSFAAQPDVPQVPEPAAVELPEDAENDDDEDAEEEAAYVPNNTRKVAQRAPPAPLPAGTFFPIDFGGATGGSIAVSNSFSTGANGSAKSQAIAYGKPAEPSAKSSPVRRH